MIKNILIFFFWFYHNNHTAPTHSQQFQTSHKYTNSPTFSNHNAQDKSPKFSPPLFHSPSFPPPFPPHYQRSFSKTVRYPQLNNSQSIFPFTTLPPIIVSAWIVDSEEEKEEEKTESEIKGGKIQVICPKHYDQKMQESQCICGKFETAENGWVQCDYCGKTKKKKLKYF